MVGWSHKVACSSAVARCIFHVSVASGAQHASCAWVSALRATGDVDPGAGTLLPPPESEMMRGMLDVASVTSTVCDLFGIPRPADCVAPPFSEVAAFAARRTVTKALVFAADAIGAHLVRSYAEAFEPVARHAPTSVEACAVMPSVTPVCFASMFTGAPPDTHGIRKSERPTLTCDTLFDALSRAGRRVAIVAVENSSIDLIFRSRRIDYFTETYDEEVVERTLNLVAADQHDFILAYQQEYDDKMHATVPRSQRPCARWPTTYATSIASLARRATGGQPRHTPLHSCQITARTSIRRRGVGRTAATWRTTSRCVSSGAFTSRSDARRTRMAT